MSDLSSADRVSVAGRVVVTVPDDDTDPLKPGMYRHALKRMDAGSETVLSFGNVVLLRA